MTCPSLSFAEKTVCRLGLGTWVLGGGSDWGAVSFAQAQATLQAALETGINWIDTSPVYGWGEAEERIGRVVKGVRSRLVLAGKCGICLNAQQRPDHDLTPRQIFLECETSLKRLQTDYLDLYQIHWPDPKVPLAESLAALSRLKEEGKIRSIGVCNFSLEQLVQACQITSIDCVQNQLSLLAPFPQDILSFCREKQIVFWGYGALGGGILSGKYQKEPNFKRSDARKYFYRYYTGTHFVSAAKIASRVKEMACQKSSSSVAVALAWALAQTDYGGVLVGARTAEQVRQNIEALNLDLTKSEKEFLQHG
ncbi:MAG: aldo/keto reductase [Elusimicrobiaceae bacterium]|nr:aldo/keto reductase [Elusimicrobiaceae bacterium]